jgi:hypothetical protein
MIIDKLPNNIERLGDRTFNNNGRGFTVSSLPISLKVIGTQCFMGNSHMIF